MCTLVSGARKLDIRACEAVQDSGVNIWWPIHQAHIYTYLGAKNAVQSLGDDRPENSTTLSSCSGRVSPCEGHTSLEHVTTRFSQSPRCGTKA